VSLQWDKHALDDVLSGPEAEQYLLDLGWDISRDAARDAPKGPEESAKTIHPELVYEHGLPEVHVSWDRSRFWLGFHELGTENITPKAFLRRAALKQRG
jgi:hypothetical protein